MANSAVPPKAITSETRVSHGQKKKIPNDQKVSCNVKRTKDVRLRDDLIYISCRQRNESPHICARARAYPGTMRPKKCCPTN
ncbi:hypothetical protein M408DRAFT_334413, partial [Serendipita vermifera MAFF 305830]